MVGNVTKEVTRSAVARTSTRDALPRWRRTARVADWMAHRLGRASFILGGISLLGVYGSHIDFSEGNSDDLVLGVLLISAVNALAWIPCAFGYAFHQRRVRLLAVTLSPRLQGWKNWLTENKVTRRQYDAIAPGMEKWIDGTDPLLVERLGALFLRRIGYALVPFCIVAPFVRWAYEGPFPVILTTLVGLVPLLLAVAALFIAAGVGLGSHARRELRQQKQAWDELERAALARFG